MLGPVYAIWEEKKGFLCCNNVLTGRDFIPTSDSISYFFVMYKWIKRKQNHVLLSYIYMHSNCRLANLSWAQLSGWASDCGSLGRSAFLYRAVHQQNHFPLCVSHPPWPSRLSGANSLPGDSKNIKSEKKHMKSLNA